MTENLIKVLGVSKTYTSTVAKHSVFENISLEVKKGERISLVGPNGSGKTTLLRLVLGIEQPNSGTIEVFNSNPHLRPSYVPQDYRNALFPWLRLDRNLDLPSGSFEGEDRPSYQHEFRNLCNSLHIRLDLNRYPYQISGGEQQIFVLVRALLFPSAFLVLDEPLSAVDYARKHLVQQQLGQRFYEQSATVLLATHDFEEAVLLGDRVLVFEPESGRISTVVSVDMPWPRTHDIRQSSEFRAAVAAITNSVI